MWSELEVKKDTKFNKVKKKKKKRNRATNGKAKDDSKSEVNLQNQRLVWQAEESILASTKSYLTYLYMQLPEAIPNIFKGRLLKHRTDFFLAKLLFKKAGTAKSHNLHWSSKSVIWPSKNNYTFTVRVLNPMLVCSFFDLKSQD